MDREPLIDRQTYEMIEEVYQMISSADTDPADKRLNPGDISYLHGLLRAVIMLNSTPKATDELVLEDQHDFMGRAKKIGRSLIP